MERTISKKNTYSIISVYFKKLILTYVRKKMGKKETTC